jgi:AcrR family transcriptional regulator
MPASLTPSPPAADPPRTARGQRTRRALVRAARTVFEESGFVDARTTDITRAAGVASGSFYTYFRDKEDVFTAVLADMQEEALGIRAESARSAGEPDPVEQIRAGHRLYLTAYRRNARLMSAMEQAALVNDAVRQVRLERTQVYAQRNARAIARWQQAGGADRAPDPLKAAHAIDAMASRMAELTFVHGHRASLNDLVELLTRMWAGALGMTYSPPLES